MDVLSVTLIALGVTWLIAGYITARFVNGSGMGHSFYHYLINGCQCSLQFETDWNRSVTTKRGRSWFVAGILSGWLGAAFVTVYVLADLAVYSVEGIFCGDT